MGSWTRESLGLVWHGEGGSTLCSGRFCAAPSSQPCGPLPCPLTCPTRLLPTSVQSSCMTGHISCCATAGQRQWVGGCQAQLEAAGLPHHQSQDRSDLFILVKKKKEQNFALHLA